LISEDASADATPGVDMTGKTVVVTGASSGIGLETAVSLAGLGARVLITARDAGRGTAALDTVKKRSGGDCDLVLFDLADMSSVRRGAAEIIAKTDRIDVLVNNAGLVLSTRTETPDGFESTFAINHLGPFLLTQLLTDRILASAPSRIVNVSSTAHTSARRGLDFDDLQSEKGYRAMKVYGESKLANIYFTIELARRLDGRGVTANCLHPGLVKTGYGRDGDTKGYLAIGIRLAVLFMISPEQGALTSVYLASSPEVEGVTGKYFVKCKQRSPSARARDAEAAKKLWEVSEKLVSAGGES
jgi:NAD(P)-dependent dehydrogenase (short-subunit alcohol dehydrogenase family)